MSRQKVLKCRSGTTAVLAARHSALPRQSAALACMRQAHTARACPGQPGTTRIVPIQPDDILKPPEALSAVVHLWCGHGTSLQTQMQGMRPHQTNQYLEAWMR